MSSQTESNSTSDLLAGWLPYCLIWLAKCLSGTQCTKGQTKQKCHRALCFDSGKLQCRAVNSTQLQPQFYVTISRLLGVFPCQEKATVNTSYHTRNKRLLDTFLLSWPIELSWIYLRSGGQRASPRNFTSVWISYTMPDTCAQQW